MKGLITVFKNLILGSWRVSAQDPLGFDGQQSPRLSSEASLAQPWTNSLLWSGYPGTKFFANDVSRGIDILIHPFYFLFCPWFAGSRIYASAPVLLIRMFFSPNSINYEPPYPHSSDRRTSPILVLLPFFQRDYILPLFSHTGFFRHFPYSSAPICLTSKWLLWIRCQWNRH